MFCRELANQTALVRRQRRRTSKTPTSGLFPPAAGKPAKQAPASAATETATPPKVVIQEYVRLAERYGSERSAGFVNGVLDAHARRVGALA